MKYEETESDKINQELAALRTEVLRLRQELVLKESIVKRYAIVPEDLTGCLIATLEDATERAKAEAIEEAVDSFDEYKTLRSQGGRI